MKRKEAGLGKGAFRPQRRSDISQGEESGGSRAGWREPLTPAALTKLWPIQGGDPEQGLPWEDPHTALPLLRHCLGAPGESMTSARVLQQTPAVPLLKAHSQQHCSQLNMTFFSRRRSEEHIALAATDISFTHEKAAAQND